MMNLDSLDDVLQHVTTIYDESSHDLRSWLYKEILFNALKFKRDDLSELDLKVMNRSMAEFRYAARVFKPYRDRRKVSIFGSSRTPEDDSHYQMAVDFAQRLVRRGFMVITGAAEGVMKAGNVGAGAENSFGANILLPFESANEVMADDPKLITFRYFFTRKLFFIMEAQAIVLFPGGFGTHDEGFETLTLLQTGKTPPMPFILMELPGDNYWETWDSFVREQMVGRGMVSPEDLSLYRIIHSAEEAVEWICSYYSTFHSLRQVRDKLVLRLERELTDEAIEQLNEEFTDLVRRGSIEKTGPLAPESNQPELLSKPRIAFVNARKSAARLHELILAINRLGS